MTSEQPTALTIWARRRLHPWERFKLCARRRFHPLERLGFAASKSSQSKTQTVVSLSIMGLGYYLRKSSVRTVLYRHTAQPGESVRIKVIRGTTTLADSTVET